MIWLILIIATGTFPLFAAILAACGGLSCFVREPEAKPLTAPEVGRAVGQSFVIIAVLIVCWAIILALEP